MQLFRRVIPFSSFLLIALTGFLLQRHATFAIPISVLSLGILILLASAILLSHQVALKDKIGFYITIVLFSTSGFSFLFFLERIAVIYIFVGVFAVLYAVYIENIYRYVFVPSTYHVSALANIAAYLNYLTLFFITVGIGNLIFFFGFPLLWIIVIGAFFSFGSLYAFFWSQHIPTKKALGGSGLLSFLYLQLLIVLTFWPHIPLVKGIVILALMYGMMQITLFTYTAVLNTRRVIRISLFVAVVLLLILSSAQWF